jgi:hypothetical protein
MDDKGLRSAGRILSYQAPALTAKGSMDRSPTAAQTANATRGRHFLAEKGNLGYDFLLW